MTLITDILTIWLSASLATLLLFNIAKAYIQNRSLR